MNRRLLLTIILLLITGFLLQGVYAAADIPSLKTTAVSSPPLVSIPSAPTIHTPIGPSANIPDSPVNKPVSGIVHSPVMGVQNSVPSYQSAQEEGTVAQGSSSLSYAPDRLIVRFNTDLASAAGGTDSIAQQAHATTGATVIADEKTLGVSGMQVLSVPGGTDLMGIIKLYEMNPYVLYAEPDYKYSINSTTFNPPVVVNPQAVSYLKNVQERTTSSYSVPVSSPSAEPCKTCGSTSGFATPVVSQMTAEDRLRAAQEEVDAINAYNQENGLEWTAEVNHIMLKSPEERDSLKGLMHDTPVPELMNVESSPIVPLSGLPTSFDWRNQNGDWTTPVRNQGSCGSCWAFATTGVFESYLERKTGNPNLNPDYAEEYLVQCAADQYGCGGGYFSSMAYFVDKVGATGGVGTVTEPSYPYTARDGTCKSLSGYTRYKIDTAAGERWRYVGSGEWSIPSTDAIKTAIYTYGPIVAGVYAESTFDSYRSGILDSTASASYANHAIIIAGWGELNGRIYWICKNSWGTNWGEQGWFRIYAGRLRIGEGAAYFQYSTTPTVGSISVSSSPSGARIWLDGTDSGKTTPVTLTEVTTGSHTIKLTISGYQDYTTTVSVTSGQTTSVSGTLSPADQTGSISISSSPTAARIWLDGADTGKSTPATVTGVPTGTRTVKLTKSGYLDYSTTVSVTAGQTATVSGTLTQSGGGNPVFPNDPSFNKLWGLHNTGQTGGTANADINAPEAWSYTTGSSSVIVAVIDTGVDAGHGDLTANTLSGYNFITSTAGQTDDNGHGTHCAGTIGAVGNNGIGVTGVAWNVKILPLKFLDASGSGYTSNAVKAINYAKTNGAHIISNSWGGTSYSQALKDAIDASNALFVCAAGNSGQNTDSTPHYPSAYNSPNIISVAATDHRDALASFSNYGQNTVHVGAPGVSIYSTYPSSKGNYATLSGTSMATPHVAGMAALIKSANPGMNTADLKSVILSSVDTKSSLSGKCLTGGRINAEKAVMTGGDDNYPPTLSSLSPNKGTVGTTVTVTVTGSRFTSPMTAVLERDGADPIPATTVVVNSPSKMTCTFPIPMQAPAGLRALTVANQNGGTASRPDAFTIGLLPTPKITSVSPTSGIVGTTVSVTIKGSNLHSSATVQLWDAADPDGVFGTNVAVSKGTTLTAKIALPWAMSGGKKSITVTNPDGQKATLNNVFTVTGAAEPVVTGISPASGMIGSTVSFTLTGRNYINGLSVNLTRSGEDDIVARNVKISSSTKATGQFVIPMLDWNSQGTYNLVTSYPSGHTSIRENGFTINPLPAPKITSVSPASSTVGSSPTLTIKGTNLRAPVTVHLWDATYLDGIEGTNVVVSKGTSLTTKVVLPWDMPGGKMNLTVTNPDGQKSTLTNIFTVVGAAEPVFTGISPASGMIGSTVSFTLTGRNYINGLSVVLTKPGQDDIAARNVKIASGTKATGQFVIPMLDWGSQGAYNLVTSYPSGHTSIRENAFVINPLPAPKITSISPTSGKRGSAVTMTIKGSAFRSPLEVKLWDTNDPSGILGTNIALSGSTSLKARFALPSSALTGKKSITITNPDGQQGTFSNKFTLT